MVCIKSRFRFEDCVDVAYSTFGEFFGLNDEDEREATWVGFAWAAIVMHSAQGTVKLLGQVLVAFPFAFSVVCSCFARCCLRLDRNAA